MDEKGFGERNLKLQKGSLPHKERTQQHRVISVCAKTVQAIRQFNIHASRQKYTQTDKRKGRGWRERASELRLGTSET